MALRDNWVGRLEAGAGLMALQGLNAVARRCPEALLEPLGKGVGRFVFRASRRYREVALRNLQSVFAAERSAAEIRDLARSVFEHFGRVALEFFWLQRVRPERLMQLVDFPEELQNTLRQLIGRGRGAILITAHFGNWELLGRVMAARGYPLSVVARDSDDPTQAGFVNSIRAQGGLGIISRGEPVGRMLEVLRRNEFLAILPDQNTIRDPLFVPFFGRLASVAPGVALLAIRSGSPILPGFATRTATGWRVDSYPEVPVPQSGPLKDRILEVSAAYTAIIEQHIRRYPEQWLWFHDRWRRRPDEEQNEEQV
ncbi:MAG: lipid A biosynthesis acyltransferase [Armatimonadota bacterium]|nr:MAG: lipid A biosynthesis acyltransferase [Armatimonadota bacterium]